MSDLLATARRFLPAAVLLAVIWALAISLWPQLPERLPAHFNAAGVPDRWSSKESGGWFLLPGVATGLDLLLFGIALLMPRMARTSPAMINLPRKKEFLALPPEARVSALAPAGALFAGCAALLDALFLYLMWGTYAVAGRQWSRLPATGVFAFLAALVLWVGIATLTMMRSVRAATEATRATTRR